MKFLRRGEIPSDLIIDDLGDMRSYHDQAADDELVEDIKLNGVHDPILLRPHPSKKYEGMFQIIDGRRRFRCNKIAGNYRIPAEIYEMENYEASRMALSRNVQRENPDPVGLGFWLNRIMEEDPEIKKQKDLAKFVNKSEAWISNMLKAYKLALESAKKNSDEGGLDITQLISSSPTARHARALRSAPPNVKNQVIEMTQNGPWPSSREIERMARARMTPKEFLEQYDPTESRFDNAFLAHRLSINAGLTTKEAQEIVEKWRSYGLPWQSLRKRRKTTIRKNDPQVQLYHKLTDIYPVELIDLVDRVAPAKTEETMKKYCRRLIYTILKKVSEELKQTALDEFRGIA